MRLEFISSVATLEDLYEYNENLGIEFLVEDGKITDVSFSD